jgi:Sec-independent protein secretion pathway component TatC
MRGALGAELPRLVGALKRTGAVFLAAFGAAVVVPLSPTASDFSFTASGIVKSSLAVVVLRWLEASLVPPGETLLAVGPFDAFLGITWVGAMIAALVAVPYAAGEAFRYAGPGLTGSERRAVRDASALAVALFAAGASATLLVGLPALYSFNLQLQPVAGVAPTVALLPLLSTTALFTVGFGAAFEAPAVCYALASAGAIGSAAMRRYWRHALLGSFVAAFVISPGVGGGILETAMGAAIFSSYLLGYRLVRGVERRRALSRHRTLAQVAA